MNRTLIGLYALLWLFAAGRACSQSAEDAPADPKPAPKPAAGPAATEATVGIYEEVEILRRLLNRELASAYGLPAHAVHGTHFWFTPSGTQYVVSSSGPQRLSDGHHQLAGAEGVYVKGCGVVYSATLPPTSRPALPQAAPAVLAPPSPWEQARAELRGEKLRPAEEKAAARQVPLSESLLRVLADNGRHFRHLPENETITVALTFRGGLACTQCHVAVGSSSAGGPTALYKHPVIANAPPATSTAGGGSAGRTDPGPYVNEVLMGDLHVRQGRLDAAVSAYTGALHTLSQTLNHEKERQGGWEVKTLLASVEVANKLAQVYTTQGDSEKALKYLEVARRSAQWAEERAQGKPATAGGVPLPSRLVLSAPKKILDQVAAAKMTFEEFRKAAAVEYLTFPAADKTDPKGKP
jgi:hypothetical protein